MPASWLGPEVSVEGEEAIDTVDRCIEVLSDELGRWQGDIAEVLVDLLQCGKNQLLRFLKVPRLEVGEHLAHHIQIDLLLNRVRHAAPPSSRCVWPQRTVRETFHDQTR